MCNHHIFPNGCTREILETGSRTPVLAEASSNAYFVSKDYARILPPEGSTSSISGEFDRIYRGPGGEIVIVEAKGGLSKLKSREIRKYS